MQSGAGAVLKVEHRFGWRLEILGIVVGSPGKRDKYCL